MDETIHEAIRQDLANSRDELRIEKYLRGVGAIV